MSQKMAIYFFTPPNPDEPEPNPGLRQGRQEKAFCIPKGLLSRILRIARIKN
jgi:hypothetical protein